MDPLNTEGYSRGVGVFIVQTGNKLLLTHRLRGEQPGVWEVVAGHVKDGESAEATAIREAQEEAGIEIRICAKIGQNIDHTHRFVATMLLAEVVSGEAHNLAPRHHSALEWFRLEALPEPLGSTTKAGLVTLRQRGILS